MNEQRAIIIGSGPAGLTAGIYLARASFKPLLIEGMEQGGQLMTTTHVDNFPGLGKTTGPAIIKSMRDHAERLGVAFAMDQIELVVREGDRLVLKGMIDEYSAPQVLLATGASVRKTGLPGEAQYWGRGISACLHCDAAFYAGRRVVVVGNGQSAIAAKTYLERSGCIVAATLRPDQVGEFKGEGGKLAEVGGIKVDGAFLVTARIPQTDFIPGLERDENGYVVTHERVLTNIPGLFAAGDCCQPHFRQAVIAAGDGAYAAMAMIGRAR